MTGNQLDFASIKEILTLLATPRELDSHPLVDWLVDAYLQQHPTQANLMRGELLGWALASLWRERFMPERLATEFARDWNNFLVLEVAYFYPFRTAKRVPDGLVQATFPANLGQIGVLLADKEHLATVIVDPFMSRLANRVENSAYLLAAIVPNQKDRDTGAVLVTTVAYRRDMAIQRLTDELNQLGVAIGAAQPLEPTHSLATNAAIDIPVTSSTGGLMAESGSTTVISHESIDGHVKQRLTHTSAAVGIAGLQEKALRLAQYLAAIQLRIEFGPVPTSKLTRANLDRALRGVGIEPKQGDTGYLVVRFLERAQILLQLDGWWEFSDPDLVDYFGAEYISDYGCHWVSLRPIHRRVMGWAAGLLARRKDEQRTHALIQDIKVAMRQMSELSWLEVADILAEFQGFDSPVVTEFQSTVISALTNLTEFESVRLCRAVAERLIRLGVDADWHNSARPCEVVIPPSEMDTMDKGDLYSCLTSLNVQLPSKVEREWLEDRTILHALINNLNSVDSEQKLRNAAWLKSASLSPSIELVIDLKAPWRTGLISALEHIAQMALDPSSDDFTCTLCRSILCRDEFILRLFDLGKSYWPLVYTLLLALDKRLNVHHCEIVE